MPKVKYSAFLNDLQNLIGYRPTHSEIGKIIKKSVNALSNRLSNNGFLNDEEQVQIKSFYKLTNTKDNFVHIPVRGDVSASLGFGCIVDNENQTAVCEISPNLIKALGANKDMTDIIFSRGDSMFPTINDGDALMVDRSKKEIIDGKIYCIRLDGQLLAKRLQKTPPFKIKVISDNEKYDSFYVDLSTQQEFDFEIVGQVLLFSRIV